MVSDGRDMSTLVAGESGFAASDPLGHVGLMQGEFDTFDGNVERSPMLRIALATRGGGRYYQKTDAGETRGIWKAGDIVVVPPNAAGEGRSAKAEMIGLAINLGQAQLPVPESIFSRLSRQPRRPLHDPAMSATLLAMRFEAETHGCSTAFFQHGAARIVERLAFVDEAVRHRSAVPMDAARLTRVTDYLEANLASEVTVAEMALVANYEVSGFSRALKRTIGATPYQYLTQLRMRKAKSLLSAGMPVALTASHVGYSNPSKFAAAFRRVFGQSPCDR